VKDFHTNNITTMKLALILLAAVMVCGITAKQDDEEQVSVPSDVLRFILGCQRDAFGEPTGPLPVYHTDINTNTGTTSQKVTLLDMDQLRESLKGSVQSEEVLDLIISRLSAAVRGVANTNNRVRHDGVNRDSNSTSDSNQGCTINNNIEVSVPAQEVDSFNDRVQMLIQQNSLLLLEQINTLFTYKLRSLREDFENMVQQRNKKINRKLDAILKALDVKAPVEPEDEAQSPVSEPITESSSEVDSSTDDPTEVDQDSKEDTTDTPSDDDDEEEEVDGTRKAALRPVPVPTSINNRPRFPGSRPRFPSSRPTPTKVEGTVATRPTQSRYPSAAGARPRPSRPNSDSSRQRQLQRQSFMRRQRKPTSVPTEDEEESPEE